MSINLDEKQEKKQGNRQLAWILQQQDKKLIAEHKWDMANVCPKCRLVLTKRGICPMEC